MKGWLVDDRGRRFRVERVGTGLYRDDTGALHIVVAEILRAHGWPETPENIQVALEAAAEVAAQQFPGVPITR